MLDISFVFIFTDNDAQSCSYLSFYQRMHVGHFAERRKRMFGCMIYLHRKPDEPENTDMDMNMPTKHRKALKSNIYI